MREREHYTDKTIFFPFEKKADQGGMIYSPGSFDDNSFYTFYIAQKRARGGGLGNNSLFQNCALVCWRER